MSKFLSDKYSSLIPYTPGEQPQDRKYLKLNTNESPYPPSPIAARLAREAAGDLQLYSDPECKKLTEVAADYFSVDTDEIIFTNGSDEGLNFAVMAFCDDSHPMAFADVTYGFYQVIADLNNVPVCKIPLCDDFTINVDDYIGINKTIFIANPNAPTGIALSRSDIEKIVSTNKNNIVVVDEAYVDFGAESSVPLIHKYDNVIVCGTFSKSRSLAGGRLGYMIASKELIRDLNTIKYSCNPYNINRMTMAAGIGAFTDDEYFKTCSEKIKATRSRAAEKLKNSGFTVIDSKANFLFAKTDKIGGNDLYLKMKEKGVLIRHFETERLKDYNRITVGSDEQMDKFFEILSEVLEEIK